MKMKEKTNRDLVERHKIEENYHDTRYKQPPKPEDIRGRSQSAFRLYKKLWGNVEGKKVLDFGCGNGWVSVGLVRQGARAWGIDISGELIKQAKDQAEQYKLSDKIVFEKMAGEHLAFEDNFFDLVVGHAILHHTDIDLAVRQIFRVLKPGGRAIFMEPMNQNILLKFWRLITPWRRSPTEKALTQKELQLIREIGPKTAFHFLGLISIITDGLIVIIGNNILTDSANSLAEKIDKIILNTLPFLGKYCALVVVEMKK